MKVLRFWKSIVLSFTNCDLCLHGTLWMGMCDGPCPTYLGRAGGLWVTVLIKGTGQIINHSMISISQRAEVIMIWLTWSTPDSYTVLYKYYTFHQVIQKLKTAVIVMHPKTANHKVVFFNTSSLRFLWCPPPTCEVIPWVSTAPLWICLEVRWQIERWWMSPVRPPLKWPLNCLYWFSVPGEWSPGITRLLPTRLDWSPPSNLPLQLFLKSEKILLHQADTCIT